MLHPLTWPQIRERWEWIRAGLQSVIARTGERWIPEDVYQALQHKRAFLHTVERGGGEVGFIVLCNQMDPDGPVLHIWALWGEPGEIAPLRGDIERELVELGKRIGARRLRMESPREGWTDISFWRPAKTIYEHSIE